MPDAEFNESTFQTLFIYEHINRLSIPISTIQPVFPTLRAEKTLGYDALIRHGARGGQTFYQFKITHKRVRLLKNDVRRRMTVPYMTFDIHSAAQHNLMRNLDAHFTGFYVANLFLTRRELYDHATRHDLHTHSILIRASHARRVHNDKHRFVIQGGGKWQFQSDGSGIGTANVNEALARAQSALKDNVPFEELIERTYKVIAQASTTNIQMFKFLSEGRTPPAYHSKVRIN